MSFDNKYVQYRLVSLTWSTDIHDWTSEDPYFIDKIMQEVNEAIDENTPIEIHGDVTNAPDEEDLTSVNVGGTDVLKFKDKAYNPLTYSGLGRKILRKNIVDGVNTLTQSMMQDANTIYVIQYDFSIGSVTKGNVVTSDSSTTIVSNLQCYYVAIQLSAGKCLSLLNIKDCFILKDLDAMDEKNYVIADSDTTIYIGTYSSGTYENAYQISDYISVPEGCLLKFEGGSVSDGALIGNNTDIVAGNEHIFKDSLTIGGSFNCTANVLWFGVKPSGMAYSVNIDTTYAFQRAIDSSFFHLFVPIGWYYITSTLIVSEAKWIEFDGIISQFRAGNKQLLSCATIYVNSNIDIMRVILRHVGLNAKRLKFTGGCLDSSMVGAYTKTALSIASSAIVYGVEITTSMYGSSWVGNSSDNSIGIHLTRDYGNPTGGLYFVNIHDNYIDGYTLGLKVDDRENFQSKFITNTVHTGQMRCKKGAVLGDQGVVLGGTYQTIPGYSEESDEAFFEVKMQGEVTITGILFDIAQEDSTYQKWTTPYFLEVHSTVPITDGVYITGPCSRPYFMSKIKGNKDAVFAQNDGVVRGENIVFTGSAYKTYLYNVFSYRLISYNIGDIVQVASVTIPKENKALSDSTKFIISSQSGGGAEFVLQFNNTYSNPSTTFIQTFGTGNIIRNIIVLRKSYDDYFKYVLCVKKLASGDAYYPDILSICNNTVLKWNQEDGIADTSGATTALDVCLYSKTGTGNYYNSIKSYLRTGDIFYERTNNLWVFKGADGPAYYDGVPRVVTRSGNRSQMPIKGLETYLYEGFCYFLKEAFNDSKPIFWNGSYWVNGLGERLTWPVNYNLTNIRASEQHQAFANEDFTTTFTATSGSLPEHLNGDGNSIKMGEAILSNEGVEYEWDSITGVLVIHGVNRTTKVIDTLTITVIATA